MHVLLIANELSYFQAHRRDLMDDLLSRGVRVSVATGGSIPGAVPDRPVDWPEGVGFHPFRIDRHRLNVPLDIGILRHIRRLCRRIRPDVVHAITIKPVLFTALALSAFAPAPPPALVLTLPGLGKVFEPTRSMTKRLRRWLVTRALRLAARRTGAVMTTENPQDRDRLVTLGIVPEARARAIAGTGLDFDLFNAQGRMSNAGAVRILMASRLIETKGVGLYLETARRLGADRTAVQFDLAGPIDPSDKDAIDANAVHSATAQGHVSYLGSIAPQDMARTLRQYDIVCLPTLLQEGFPRALLEAVACGCVPVASDQAAIRQLVKDGETGLLLDPVTVEMLENALQKPHPRWGIESALESQRHGPSAYPAGRAH